MTESSAKRASTGLEGLSKRSAGPSSVLSLTRTPWPRGFRRTIRRAMSQNPIVGHFLLAHLLRRIGMGGVR
jgi:hypothetical protein